MLGERVPAPKALEWGLINRVVGRRRADERGRGARRPPRRRARRAPTRAPSASSTPGSSRAWRPSWSSRPRSSSELGRIAATSSRASPRSWRSARRASTGPELTAARRRPRRVLILPALVPEGRTPRLLLAAALALAVALLAAPAAHAGLLFPESGGSPNADSIKTLYIMVFVLALFIFAGVEGTLLWSLWRYRARKGRTAAQIHGNTKLEVGWTVGAAVILIFITVFTFIKLPCDQGPEAVGWSTPTARRWRCDRQRPGRRDRHAAARGPDDEDRRQRPAVRVALQLSRPGPAARPTPTWSCRSA